MRIDVGVRPRELARILVIVAVALSLVSIAGQIWEVALGGGLLYGVIPLLNVDVEGSLSTLFQALLMLVAGVLAWICGSAGRRAAEPGARTWFLLAIAFGYLGVDEATQLHEILILPTNRLLGTSEILVWLWLLPVAPVLLALGVVVRPFLRHVDRQTRRILVIAAGLYLGGTVLMELVNGWAAARVGTFTVLYRVVLVTIEESLEAAGLIVLTFALLDHLGRHDVRVHLVSRTEASGS